MQRMGHQRFAGAGFAIDQNMPIRLPQIKNIFLAGAPSPGLTDQLFHQLATSTARGAAHGCPASDGARWWPFLASSVIGQG